MDNGSIFGHMFGFK